MFGDREDIESSFDSSKTNFGINISVLYKNGTKRKERQNQTEEKTK